MKFISKQQINDSIQITIIVLYTYVCILHVYFIDFWVSFCIFKMNGKKVPGVPCVGILYRLYKNFADQSHFSANRAKTADKINATLKIGFFVHFWA